MPDSLSSYEKSPHNFYNPWYVPNSIVDGGTYCTPNLSVVYCMDSEYVTDNECIKKASSDILYADVRVLGPGKTCEAADFPLDPADWGKFTWNGRILYVSDGCLAQFNVRTCPEG